MSANIARLGPERADRQRSKLIHDVASSLRSLSMDVADVAVLGDQATLQSLKVARARLKAELERVDRLLEDAKTRIQHQSEDNGPG